MPARAPEVSLDEPVPSPGTRVAYAGVHGHRVIEVAGDVLTLRPPHGGRVIATAAEVMVHPETAAERESNLREEADIARMLSSVKALSRQRRSELNRDADAERAEALDAVGRAFHEGKVGLDRYVYAMSSTKNAPLAANHAVLAIVTRSHLTNEQYSALTGPARRAGATLPD